MSVWFSSKVKPIFHYPIVVAYDGDIFSGSFYNDETDSVFSDSYGGYIDMSDPLVDGWCYRKDLYPKETKI